MQNTKEKNFDVFISYRHETGFYMAQLIYTKLLTNGYTVFMDKTMDSGKYEEKIHSAISNARNYIVVLFPKDKRTLRDPNSWLNKEATWALETPGITIIPVMCDGFSWPRIRGGVSGTMKRVSENQGITVHKDYSLDADLDKLCDGFLKNVSPSKPQITTTDFFRYNLEQRTDFRVCGVDVAFHAGVPWLRPGEQHDLLLSSLKKGTPWRVLINTADAAESIACHMRDKTASYTSFSDGQMEWKKLASLYPQLLEVRECNIPLIHVYHSVRFMNEQSNHSYGELHIKYYAYNNSRMDNVFEHKISSYSKYYSIYNEEFEFLWAQSKTI